jgi:hypothetical protein
MTWTDPVWAILCHAGQEAMALRIGWAYEQATGGRNRRPPEA